MDPWPPHIEATHQRHDAERDAEPFRPVGTEAAIRETIRADWRAHAAYCPRRFSAIAPDMLVMLRYLREEHTASIRRERVYGRSQIRE